MKFLIIITTKLIILHPTTLPHPCISSTPKTLEEALVIIQNLAENQTKLIEKSTKFINNLTKLTENQRELTENITKLTETQRKLDNEVKEIYQLILDNNADIPVTYKPEIMEWLRKLNQHNKKMHWKLGYQFQGFHPGLVVKYNKNFTRALVFPVSHANQYSDHFIPIRLPNDRRRTSFILVDQLQNVCASNIGPARIGALTEEMWNEIYQNYPFLREYRH